jgi:hypothetical protein
MYQDDEFERFCRQRFEKICINEESYESYKMSNYEYLERIYINSIGERTIH